MQVNYNSPPRDKPFLAYVGFPWSVFCYYNKADDCFYYQEMQIGIYEGEYTDTYFESEKIDEGDIIGWWDMPEPSEFDKQKINWIEILKGNIKIAEKNGYANILKNSEDLLCDIKEAKTIDEINCLVAVYNERLKRSETV